MNLPTPMPLYLFLALVALASGVAHGNETRSDFLASHCYDCHQGDDAAAGLDLAQLDEHLDKAEHFDRWVKIFDRVSNREMPPPEDAEPIDAIELGQFTSSTGDWLREHQAAVHQQLGRVRGRRLTNLQLERTLHDLLGIDIPLEREMPEEPKSDNFSTLANRQTISHFHFEQHIKIVDLSLDEAFRRALTPTDERRWEMTARDISRTRERTREPEFIKGAAVVWSSTLNFYGRLPATSAPVSGWYRFQFEVNSLNEPSRHGVGCTIRSGQCVSSAPLMSWIGSFEATRTPQVVTVEAFLPEGHMLEVRPGDSTLKLAKFQGGQSANGEGGAQNVPGVEIKWLNMERIHRGPDDSQIRSWLFGDLAVVPAETRDLENAWIQASVLSNQPKVDGRALIESFAQRAFRRPVNQADLEDFMQIFERALDGGASLAQALRTGYRAILCSARFMHFQEQPGELDGFAMASRLSYFLWNSMPDSELLRLAEQGALTDPGVVRDQISRMLQTERGQQFIADFAGEWLELSEIDFTDPDRKIHPDFDILVQNSMLDETRSFLQEMLDKNLSVRQFVDCDYTYANDRLARFYELAPIAGHEIRKVSLEPGSHRGGLLAQGAILKVTANGTNTSPVLRGVWVSRRILGRAIPPPPDSVPAIEPDIRGAKTIREQLEKHRSMSECAACHQFIDAPGFALENFDAAGKWRQYYPRIGGNRPTDGIKVDASYVTAAGESFDNFESFCKLTAADPTPLARNLIQQLLTYGTGASMTFADRPEIEKLVSQVAEHDFGMRSILEEVVTSRIFMSK